MQNKYMRTCALYCTCTCAPTTNLEVAHDNGDFSTSDAEDDVDEQQEAEDVVILVHPYGRHHEEQLHEARAEG